MGFVQNFYPGAVFPFLRLKNRAECGSITAPMKKQLLIFDLDGTLADTRADLTTAINRMRTHYSLPPLSVDTVTGFVGNGIRKLVERSLQGVEGIDVEEAVELDRSFYLDHMLEQTALYPGVEAGLCSLQGAGHVLAVLSNKPGDPTRLILAHLGVSQRFVRMIGGGDLPNLKPAPDGINTLMEQTGTTPENTWMIGDHHTDLESAHRAGVNGGFVSYGIGHPGEFTADQTWHGFNKLTEFFL